MNFTSETWLILCIYILYLSDSTRLVVHNQLILTKYSGRWRVICPDSRWIILKKIPYFMPIFFPGALVFCSTWSVTDRISNTYESNTLDGFINAISPLNYCAVLLFILMCICMPVSIFIYGTGLAFLSIVFAIYTTILVMLGLLYRKRYQLEISNKAYISLMFDCIACPPFAINLVRKITWQYPIKFNPVDFALKNLSVEDFRNLIDSLISRLDLQLLSLEDNTTQYIRLLAYKEILSEFYNECK